MQIFKYEDINIRFFLTVYKDNETSERIPCKYFGFYLWFLCENMNYIIWILSVTYENGIENWQTNRGICPWTARSTVVPPGTSEFSLIDLPRKISLGSGVSAEKFENILLVTHWTNTPNYSAEVGLPVHVPFGYEL